MSKRSTSIILVLFVVAALVLAACGGAQTSSQSNNGGNSGSSSQASSSNSNSGSSNSSNSSNSSASNSSSNSSSNSGTQASASSSNGTIVDSLFEEPNRLNPILGPSMTYQTMAELALYSGLVQIKPDGTMYGQLATQVPTTSNGGITNNGLTYTFHLRKGVKWSDGTPFTAKDVDCTWKLIMNKQVTPRTTVGFKDIKSSKIIDDHTIQFNLKHVDPSFLLAWQAPIIIPNEVWCQGMKPSEVNNAKQNTAPKVTLGPFKFKSWDQGNEIDLVRDPNYFGGQAKVKNLVFKIIPDQNSQLAAIKNGDANVYYFAPITQLSTLKSIPGADVHVTKQNAFEHIDLNENNPILQNLKVRQALNYALDKNVFVKNVWKGDAVVSAGPLDSATWAFDKNLKPYPYDPAKAKKLLKEAGWKMGSDGYRHKNGKTLELTAATTSKNPWRAQDQKIYQNMYKAVGVKIDIHDFNAAAYFGKVLPGGKTGSQGGWDLGEYEWAYTYDPGVDLTQLYGKGSPDNFTGFTTPKLQSLIDKVNQTVGHSARKPIFDKIQQYLHDQAPVVYLYAPEEIDVSRGITGYKPNPWSVDTWNIGDWALKSN